jgi:ABC-type Fe3+-hydroxamate transport system substrate-binding protein
VRRALLALGGLAAAALLLTACGERPEPTGTHVKVYPVTVESGADGELTFDSQPRHIAVLDPNATSLLEALGAGPLLMQLPAARAAQLAALRASPPDLLVASPTTSTSRIDEARRAAAAPVYVAPLDSYTGIERAARDLGLIVGQPLAGREIVDRLEAASERVQQALEGKLPVSFFLDLGFFTSIPNGSYAADLLREAGGRNVNDAGRGPIDPAALLSANPEVYLVSSDSGTTLADLRKDPHARRLDAVRQGRVEVVDSSLLQPGPYADRALLELTSILHPDALR